jgi:hypothetical protein
MDSVHLVIPYKTRHNWGFKISLTRTQLKISSAVHAHVRMDLRLIMLAMQMKVHVYMGDSLDLFLS